MLMDILTIVAVGVLTHLLIDHPIMGSIIAWLIVFVMLGRCIYRYLMDQHIQESNKQQSPTNVPPK